MRGLKTMKRKLIISLLVLSIPIVAIAQQQTMRLGGGLISISRLGAIVLQARSDKTIALNSPTDITGATSVTGATTFVGNSVLTGTLTQNGIIRQSTTLSLSAAQIIAMGTTPVEIVAAPGAGKAIIVDSVTFKMVRTATAFTGGGDVEFRYTNAEGDKVTADVAEALVDTAGAATAFANVRGIEASITPVANAAIVITNATAAFAAGTGTAVLTIEYHVAI
jgi:hypothetical protein